MARFAIGQYIELATTVPSPTCGSINSGTRGVIREHAHGHNGDRYSVAPLANEVPTDELLWLAETDLLEA